MNDTGRFVLEPRRADINWTFERVYRAPLAMGGLRSLGGVAVRVLAAAMGTQVGKAVSCLGFGSLARSRPQLPDSPSLATTGSTSAHLMG
jgi:hypothetical protein